MILSWENKTSNNNLSLFLLDAVTSPITYPCQSVIDSDFGDSYRIYRACWQSTWWDRKTKPRTTTTVASCKLSQNTKLQRCTKYPKVLLQHPWMWGRQPFPSDEWVKLSHHTPVQNDEWVKRSKLWLSKTFKMNERCFSIDYLNAHWWLTKQLKEQHFKHDHHTDCLILGEDVGGPAHLSTTLQTFTGMANNANNK